MGVVAVKIAIISDTHFGGFQGTEREGDDWEAAGEALRKAEEQGADLIIHGGDVFDGKLPRPEVWSRALELFAGVDVPVAVIHGNHERRGKGLVNPVQALSKSGLVDYLNGDTAIYESEGQTVAIHGMGWVPEKYAADVLKHWAPEPVEDAYNVLVLHQSIDPFIYSPLNPPSLKLEHMPPGFDMYVNGHIHERQVTEVNGSPFAVVGSTITTQVNKAEAENPKGFLMVTLGDEVEVQEIELESARKVFYKEFTADGTPDEIRVRVKEWLDSLEEGYKKRPLVRARVTGSLPKGVSRGDIDLKSLTKQYDYILSIGTSLEEAELSEKMELLDDVRERRVSVQEMGFRVLREHLEEQESSFKFENVFDYLVDGDVDSALSTMLSETEIPSTDGIDDEVRDESNGLARFTGDTQ